LPSTIRAGTVQRGIGDRRVCGARLLGESGGSFEVAGLEREQSLTEQREGHCHVVAVPAAEHECLLVVRSHLGEPIRHVPEPDEGAQGASRECRP
jgi:hypothetical protein